MKVNYIDNPSFLPKSAIDAIESVGVLQVFRDLPDPEAIVERLNDCDIAIVEWSEIPSSVFQSLNGRLKHIVLVTTGYSHVDVAAARAANIDVSNCPKYSTQSVAEHVFACFLELSKSLRAGDALVRSGVHAYTAHSIGRELFSSTLGVIGLGDIGKHVARIGAGFGMQVLSHNRSERSISGVRSVSLLELASESDFIAVCVTDGAPSAGLLNDSFFELVRPTAILSCITSNSVFSEGALLSAMARGALLGVALEEPIDELLGTNRVLFSPGAAWYTQASLDRNAAMFSDIVVSSAGGRKLNLVN